MKRNTFLVTGLVAFGLSFSVAADVVRTEANNGNLVMEDVPPIPQSIVADLNRYQNTRSAAFRGWDKADLPKSEHDLPQKTLAWMRQYCEFVFVTTTSAQREWLKREGFFIRRAGKGEDDSELTCGFPCDNGSGVWNYDKPK